METTILEKRYSEKETAEILGISKMSVRRRRKDGSLGFYQLGNRILIGDHHIAEFLARSEQRLTKQN